MVSFAVSAEIVITLFVLAVISMLLLNEQVEEGSADVFVALSIGAGVLCGSCISLMATESKRILAVLLPGSAYVVLQFLAGMLLFDGMIVGVVRNVLAAVTGTAVVIYFATRPVSKKVKRKKRSR